MAISNDWQVINELNYITLNSNARFMDEASCRKIASAIGWEVVHLADYTASVDIRGYTYDTTNIYLLRPVADVGDTEYPCAISLFFYQNLSSWISGDAVFNLNDGTYIKTISGTNYCPASVLLLRPTATGCFAFNVSSQYHYFDKFYNPKTDVTKWGLFNTPTNQSFVDLYTGLFFDPKSFSSNVDTFADGGFVALKKVTLLSTEGIYNAKTIYRYLEDYNSYIVKTVELNGVKYVNVDGRNIYIRLAE